MTLRSMPHIGAVPRVALWCLFLLLSSLILLYPTHLSLEFRAVQSPYVFDNLHLFAVLFLAWVGVLLLLLVGLQGKGNHDWERLVLVLLFGLVFVGFWVLLTRGVYSESFAQAYGLKYVQDIRVEQVPDPYGIEAFPGLNSLASAVQQISGLSVLDATFLFLMVNILVFCTLAFVAMRSFLGTDNMLASFGILLLLAGSAMISGSLEVFHGKALALSLFVTFVLFVAKPALLRGWEGRLMLIILLAAITITHLVTSVVVFFTVAVAYLLQKTNDKHVTSSLLALVAVLILTWEVYGTISTFGTFARLWEKFTTDLTTGIFPAYTAELGAPFITETPLWANITRYSWIAFLGLFGFGLGLVFLVTGKRRSELSGILATPLYAGVLAATGLLGEMWRVLMYLPFFTIPAVIGFFKVPRRLVTAPLLGFVFLFFVVSFPSFLVNNHSISVDAYYPSDIARAEFLADAYQRDAGVKVYTTERDALMLTYYLPQSSPDYIYRPSVERTEEAFWLEMGKRISDFSNEQSSEAKILVWSEERWSLLFQSAVGVDPTGQFRWQALEQDLSHDNKIYDNSFTQVYLAQ